MKEEPRDFLCKDGSIEKGRRNRIYIKQSVTLNPIIRTMIDYISHWCYFLYRWVNVWQEKCIVVKRLQAHASTTES